jgi:hypothetical protein
VEIIVRFLEAEPDKCLFARVGELREEWPGPPMDLPEGERHREPQEAVRRGGADDCEGNRKDVETEALMPGALFAPAPGGEPTHRGRVVATTR